MIARVLFAIVLAIALSVVCAWAGAATAFAPGTAQSPQAAIVVADGAVLRAAPRDAAQQQAQFSQGELLEVRGERMDYLQVYDHRRERGGWVRTGLVRRTSLSAAEAPQLLAVLRFVRDTPGSEALGIGFAAAYLSAAPAEVLRGADGIEAFDALGTMADRLAHRASWGGSLPRPAQAALASHLDVTARYGVGFKSFEHEGRVQVCYEGDAFRRVLAMEAAPAQKARAALALTRPECVAPDLPPLERAQMDAWRAGVLDRVEPASLAPYLKNRIHIRRAAVWSTVAYQRARAGIATADVAAQRAVAELAGVMRAELPDADQAAFAEAAMRANASRWAAVSATSATLAASPRDPAIVTVPGQPGETCVLLVDAKNGASRPLARRCTYAVVWPQSATLNREGNALALAVQPMAAWRELWVFRRQGASWTVSVLPPGAGDPEIGYAEFAGWVPGGERMLVAREARAQGKTRRSYEMVRLDSLAVERGAADPAHFAAFRRWQDPAWKRMTVSLR
jgi:hypothetical protein